MPEILIADGNLNVRENLRKLLTEQYYAVRTARNGTEALDYYERKKPDLMIMDAVMPSKTGYQVCAEIRRSDYKTPIFFLSDKSSEADKVLGLGLGADDYITKPFSSRELVARIGVALNRIDMFNRLIVHECEFQFASHKVNSEMFKLIDKDGYDVTITPRELALLQYFAAHPNIVVKREDLMNRIWGISYYGNSRTLDQHIAKLRRKLGSDGSLIKCCTRVGYKFLAPAGE